MAGPQHAHVLQRLSVLVVCCLATGCASPATRRAAPATSAPPATTSPSPSVAAPTPSPAPSPRPSASADPSGTGPAFAGTASALTAADLPSSWHPGCPVSPAQLTLLHLSYWGFDSQVHAGTLVVNTCCPPRGMRISAPPSMRTMHEVA